MQLASLSLIPECWDFIKKLSPTFVIVICEVNSGFRFIFSRQWCVATVSAQKKGTNSSSSSQRNGCCSGSNRLVAEPVAAPSLAGLAIPTSALVSWQGCATGPARPLLYFALRLAETARMIQRMIQKGLLTAARTSTRCSVIPHQDLPPRSIPTTRRADKMKQQARIPAQVLISSSGISWSSAEKMRTHFGSRKRSCSRRTHRMTRFWCFWTWLPIFTTVSSHTHWKMTRARHSPRQSSILDKEDPTLGWRGHRDSLLLRRKVLGVSIP